MNHRIFMNLKVRGGGPLVLLLAVLVLAACMPPATEVVFEAPASTEISVVQTTTAIPTKTPTQTVTPIPDVIVQTDEPTMAPSLTPTVARPGPTPTAFSLVPESLQWIMAYGSETEDSVIRFVMETKDHGFLAIGQQGKDYREPWVVRLNAAGDIVWEKGYSYAFSNAYEMRDGTFLLFGGPVIYQGGITKIDAEGNILWSKIYEAEYPGEATWFNFWGAQVTHEDENGDVSIAATHVKAKVLSNGELDSWVSYGNYVGYREATFEQGNSDQKGAAQAVGGLFSVKDSDFYGPTVFKLEDLNAWQRTFDFQVDGGPHVLSPITMKVLRNGDILFGMEILYYVPDGRQHFLIRLTPDGNIVWSRLIGQTAFESLEVHESPNGEILLAGMHTRYGANISGPNFTLWLIRLNSNGQVVWEQEYLVAANQNNITGITDLQDGGLILYGSTNEYGTGNWDGFIWKLDSNGHVANCEIDLQLGNLAEEMTPEVITTFEQFDFKPGADFVLVTTDWFDQIEIIEHSSTVTRICNSNPASQVGLP